MDWVYFSKLIPLVLSPMNLAFIFIFIALFLKRKSLVIFFATLSLSIFLISSTPITPHYLIKNLESQYTSFSAKDAPKADAILILGGAIALPLPPRSDFELVGSSDRIRYAAQLYLAKKAAKVVIAGGNVFPQENIRGEAYYISQLLSEWGVPQDDVIFEEQSRNTHQNALYIKPILAKYKLETVLLVTSATHMKRAHAVFKAQNIDVIPAPTDFLVSNNSNPELFNWIPNASSLSATTWILKEYLGWWYYKLRGYI